MPVRMNIVSKIDIPAVNTRSSSGRPARAPDGQKKGSAVGAGEQRPVVRNGALAVATVMSVTMSVDHRVVDGAIGAELLAAFKTLVEDPMTMLL